MEFTSRLKVHFTTVSQIFASLIEKTRGKKCGSLMNHFSTISPNNETIPIVVCQIMKKFAGENYY